MTYTARDLANALGPSNIYLPPTAEWKAKSYGAGMKKFNEKDWLILILDGTSLRCYRPGSLAVADRTQYVSYKKHHAFRYFISVVPNGEIAHVSKLYHGNSNDDKIYEKEGLKEELETRYEESVDGGTYQRQLTITNESKKFFCPFNSLLIPNSNITCNLSDQHNYFLYHRLVA